MQTQAAPRGGPPSPGDGTTVRDWREVLSEYAEGVQRLPAFASGRSGVTGELWETLLPVAARVVRDGVGPGPEAMEEARRWSLERIQRALQPSYRPRSP
jgi:hypothetical protein